jgi:hypothetical protein
VFLDPELVSLPLSALLAGSLAGGSMLYLSLHKQLDQELLLLRILPVFLRQNAILAILAGLFNALSGQAFVSFLQAIIAMSLIFSRIHLLRLAVHSLEEEKTGDAGARRMYLFNVGILAALLFLQTSASLWILMLMGSSR